MWDRVIRPFSGGEAGGLTPAVLTIIGGASLLGAYLVIRRAFKRAAHPVFTVLLFLACGVGAFLTGVDAPSADPDRASADQLFLGALKAWPHSVQALPAAIGIFLTAVILGIKQSSGSGARWAARILILLSAALAYVFSATAGDGSPLAIFERIGENTFLDLSGLVGMVCLGLGMFISFRPNRTGLAIPVGVVLLVIGHIGLYALGRVAGGTGGEGSSILFTPFGDATVTFGEHVGMLTVTAFLLGWATRHLYGPSGSAREYSTT